MKSPHSGRDALPNSGTPGCSGALRIVEQTMSMAKPLMGAASGTQVFFDAFDGTRLVGFAGVAVLHFGAGRDPRGPPLALAVGDLPVVLPGGNELWQGKLDSWHCLIAAQLRCVQRCDLTELILRIPRPVAAALLQQLCDLGAGPLPLVPRALLAPAGPGTLVSLDVTRALASLRARHETIRLLWRLSARP